MYQGRGNGTEGIFLHLYRGRLELGYPVSDPSIIMYGQGVCDHELWLGVTTWAKKAELQV
jgi:hypothetical protein